jgi:hypothetical protein
MGRREGKGAKERASDEKGEDQRGKWLTSKHA